MFKVENQKTAKRLSLKESSSSSLWQHIPYMSFFSDGIIRLYDGSLMASLQVHGIPGDTGDISVTNNVSNRLRHILSERAINSQIYVHRFSGSSVADYCDGQNGNSFVKATSSLWKENIDRGMRRVTYMVTIIIKPYTSDRGYGLISSISKALGKDKISNDMRKDALHDCANELEKAINDLTECLSKGKTRRLTRKSGVWLQFLSKILYGESGCISHHGADFKFINGLIAKYPVKFGANSFRIETESGTKYGSTISILEYGEETYEGMFNELDTYGNLVITNSFLPMDSQTASTLISRQMRHMRAAEDAAVSNYEKLNEALDEVASGMTALGRHHMCMTVFENDPELLSRSVEYIIRLASDKSFTMVREHTPGRAAYFSSLPGNKNYIGRGGPITAANFVGTAIPMNTPTGYHKKYIHWPDNLTVMPAYNGRAYRVNIHAPSQQGSEMTPGHSIVIGDTGSGKTVTTLFLMSMALSHGVRVIVFDKGRGMEAPIRAMGGQYYPVVGGEATGFNPLIRESSSRHVSWLSVWLLELLFPAHEPDRPSSQQKAYLYDAVRAVLNSNEDGLKNLHHLREFLKSADDGGDLSIRLSEWVKGGTYEWLFNGQGQDSLRFENSLTAFDIGDIMDRKIEKMAWMTYVFRCIEYSLCPKVPTLIVMDEAWKIFNDDYFTTVLEGWFREFRKKNAALMLLTQRPSDMSQNASLKAILQSVQTSIVFPNSGFSPEGFEGFSYNQSEIDICCSDVGMDRLALFKNGSESCLVNVDLSALGSLMKVYSGGDGSKFKNFKTWRNDSNFWKEEVIS